MDRISRFLIQNCGVCILAISLCSPNSFAENKFENCRADLREALDSAKTHGERFFSNRDFGSQWPNPLFLSVARYRALHLALQNYNPDPKFPQSRSVFELAKPVLEWALVREFKNLKPATFDSVVLNLAYPAPTDAKIPNWAYVHHDDATRLKVHPKILKSPLVLLALRHEAVHLRQNFFHFLASSGFEEFRKKQGSDFRFFMRIETEAVAAEYEFLREIRSKLGDSLVTEFREEYEQSTTAPEFLGMDFFLKVLDAAWELSWQDYRHFRLKEIREEFSSPRADALRAVFWGLGAGGAFPVGGYFLGKWLQQEE